MHWLCPSCITSVFDKRCHSCRSPYTTWTSHLTLRAWLDTCLVKCLAGDCPWQGRFENLAEHRRSCKSTQLATENTKKTTEITILKGKTEHQAQTIARQSSELALLRARKNELEKERKEYFFSFMADLKNQTEGPRPRDHGAKGPPPSDQRGLKKLAWSSNQMMCFTFS